MLHDGTNTHQEWRPRCRMLSLASVQSSSCTTAPTKHTFGLLLCGLRVLRLQQHSTRLLLPTLRVSKDFFKTATRASSRQRLTCRIPSRCSNVSTIASSAERQFQLKHPQYPHGICSSEIVHRLPWRARRRSCGQALMGAAGTALGGSVLDPSIFLFPFPHFA